MNGSGKFSTHLVPDEGVCYEVGDVVRVDQSSPQVQIIKDPTGSWEVHSYRHATEYAGTPLLRVGLRRTDLLLKSVN